MRAELKMSRKVIEADRIKNADNRGVHCWMRPEKNDNLIAKKRANHRTKKINKSHEVSGARRSFLKTLCWMVFLGWVDGWMNGEFTARRISILSVCSHQKTICRVKLIASLLYSTGCLCFSFLHAVGSLALEGIAQKKTRCEELFFLVSPFS
jgi:hypothetical protein